MNTEAITFPQATATDRAVEMVDTKGRKHLVAMITDLSGEANWCSRKFITTRNAYSKSWLQVDIKGWTLVSMMTK